MGSNDTVPGAINALQPAVAERLDPVFLEIYNRYQGEQRGSGPATAPPS